MIRDENKEQALLQQIVRGNTMAMKKFYDTYSGYLTAVCSRYIADKEDVKDILQESFIKIFKTLYLCILFYIGSYIFTYPECIYLFASNTCFYYLYILLR